MDRRKFLKNTTFLGATALFSSVAYGRWLSARIGVSHERIAISGIKHRLRIVALSDVHYPRFYGSASEIVSTINSTHPDVFIMAGDIIDELGSEVLVKMFKPVMARFAKLATLGNWEYFGKLDLAKLKSGYENSGVSLIVNDICEVQGLKIVGLDDFLFGSPDYGLIDDISTAHQPVLVISHCPESFDHMSISRHTYAIVISGHTHGGQIAPFGHALTTPKGSGHYVRGWYKKDKNCMYVMRGIGTSGPPLRIGAKPEILVLDIEEIKS